MRPTDQPPPPPPLHPSNQHNSKTRAHLLRVLEQEARNEALHLRVADVLGGQVHEVLPAHALAPFQHHLFGFLVVFGSGQTQAAVAADRRRRAKHAACKMHPSSWRGVSVLWYVRTLLSVKT